MYLHSCITIRTDSGEALMSVNRYVTANAEEEKNSCGLVGKSVDIFDFSFSFEQQIRSIACTLSE